jgi:putative transposase
MPRRARQAVGGLVYHVLNRGAGRMLLFGRPGDYDAFERVVAEAQALVPVRVFAYCLMPNHWHLLVQPRADGELSRFMFWLTMTHVQRWRHARKLVGLGPLYQGRFKAFATEDDLHFLTVARYVERNALRAGLAPRAENWRHGSAAARLDPKDHPITLAEWPVPRPVNWLTLLNGRQPEAEEEAVTTRIRSGRPYGSATWESTTADRLGLRPPRPRGRPPKEDNK